jgi:ATP-binding cassette subfamily F protein 3
LTEALNNFEGTLLVVSHDRYLIAALATQIWALEKGDDGKTQMTIFRGTYDAWVESKIAAQEQRAKSDGRKAKVEEPKSVQLPIPNPQSPAKPTPAKPNKNQEQQRLKKLEQAEQHIAQLERRLTELSWEMETAANDYPRMKTLGEEYAKVESDLAEAWTALEAIA